MACCDLHHAPDAVSRPAVGDGLDRSQNLAVMYLPPSDPHSRQRRGTPTQPVAPRGTGRAGHGANRPGSHPLHPEATQHRSCRARKPGTVCHRQPSPPARSGTFSFADCQRACNLSPANRCLADITGACFGWLVLVLFSTRIPLQNQLCSRDFSTIDVNVSVSA